MSKEIATTQSFQERMFERMREIMGDLMTDDDLKALLDRAVDEAFFKPRTVPDGHYGTKQIEPAFLSMVREELKPMVAQAAADWVREHPEEIAKTLDKVVQAGIVGMVQMWIESKTSWPIQQLSMSVQEALNKR